MIAGKGTAKKKEYSVQKTDFPLFNAIHKDTVFGKSENVSGSRVGASAWQTNDVALVFQELVLWRKRLVNNKVTKSSYTCIGK